MTAPASMDRAAALPAGLHDSVIRGLRGRPKTLSPALFYDEAGAALFEQIANLDGYYLTRAELEILRTHSAEIGELSGPGCAVIEYGSGAGVKTRLLLDALDAPVEYVPIDVSLAQLQRVAAEIAASYTLDVYPVHADYAAPYKLPESPRGARRIAFFPGSTIGNFHPPEAAAFLRRVASAVGRDGALVLGIDRVKESHVLLAAYDEPEGVTAAFNLNVLDRLNRELHADFDRTRFRHVALWNEAEARIEMHLESTIAQSVRVAGEQFELARGERIWTESSYKYDRRSLDRLIVDGGFSLARLWTDAAQRFWVAFLTAA